MTDREKVIKGLEHCDFGVSSTCYEKECPYYQSHDCTDELKNDILVLLKEQPEQKFFVDFDGKITPLSKQKHGNWIPIKSPTGVEYGGFKEYTVQEVMCSECGFTDDVSASIYTYCPECGAKMDEENEKEK